MKPLFITSKDGTKIAYETVGHGQVVIVILGALNSRKSGAKLAKLLSSQFTVVSYDRRGRNDSTDTAPYSPQREVEDVAALIGAVGGPVCLYGHSSGAAVALQAAIKLRKQVRKAAIYEAPYALDAGARKAAREYYKMLRKLLRSGRSGDAVALFVRSVGVSDNQVEAMRRLPMWRGLRSWRQHLRMTAKSWVTGILCRPISYHALPLQHLSCTAVPAPRPCAMRLARSVKPFPGRNFAL